MAGPELKGKATLDDSQMEAAFRRIERGGAAAAKKVSGAFSTIASGAVAPLAAIAAAAAAAFTGKAIVSGVTNVFEVGRALAQMSRQTGSSVQGLVVLQSKFKAAGLDAGTVGLAINRLQKSIAGVEDEENKGGAGRLRQLGLNMTALEKASPDRQLMMVGQAIARIADPAQRTATAMQIFGRSGAQLGAVFTRDFGTVSQSLQQKADMMARNAATFEQVSIKLERIAAITKTFYAGVADRVGKALVPVLSRLEKINLVGLGQAFGDGVVKGADALAKVANVVVGAFKYPGVALSAAGDALQADVRESANVLAAGADYAGQVWTKFAAVAAAVQSKVAEGTGFALTAGTERFSAGLLTSAGKFATAMEAGLGWAASNSADKLESGLLGVAKRFGEAMMSVMNPSPDKLKKLGESIGNIGAAAGKAATLGGTIASAANGYRPDAADSTLKRADENAEKARRAFKAGGRIARAGLAGLSDTPFEIKDVAGSASYRASAAAKLAALGRIGSATLFGTDGAGGAPGGATTSPAVAAGPMRMFDAVTRAAMYRANHSVGGSTMLAGDPSLRPGWTGATNATFRGGIGGGHYGATGNIWAQLSGRSKGDKDHAEATAKNTAETAASLKELVGGLSGGGGKSSAGGATATQ